MSRREFSNPNPKTYRVVSNQGKWRIWWAKAEYQASWNAPGWNGLSGVQTSSGSGWRWGFFRRMAEAAAHDDIAADRESWDKAQKLNKRKHDTYRVSPADPNPEPVTAKSELPVTDDGEQGADHA